MTSCSVSQKVDTELGQAPTLQARPRDTDHLQPSNLAARALRSVQHAPYKFGHDPCPVRQDSWRQSSAVCEKHVFFAPRADYGTEQQKPGPCGGFNTTKGKPVLFSVFRTHMPQVEGSIPGVLSSCFFICRFFFFPISFFFCTVWFYNRVHLGDISYCTTYHIYLACIYLCIQSAAAAAAAVALLLYCCRCRSCCCSSLCAGWQNWLLVH